MAQQEDNPAPKGLGREFNIACFRMLIPVFTALVLLVTFLYSLGSAQPQIKSALSIKNLLSQSSPFAALLPYIRPEVLLEKQSTNTGQVAGLSTDLALFNSHYFTYNGSPVMFLGDSATQSVMQNANIDYNAWINELASKGVKGAMVWLWMAPRQKLDGTLTESRYGYVVPAVIPWARTGTGTAVDGGKTYDLNTFDQNYFNRLTGLCTAAKNNGIVLLISVWDGGAKWAQGYSPFWGPNGGPIPSSISGTGEPFRDSLYTFDDYTTSIITQTYSSTWSWQKKNKYFQEKFADKLISEVNTAGCNNIVYEMTNEGANIAGYDDFWLNFFRARTTAPLTVNIGYTVTDANTNPNVDFKTHHTNTYDPTSVNTGWVGYFNEIPNKPAVNSESVPAFDNLWSTTITADNARRLLWSTAVAGGGAFIQDDTVWSDYDPTAPDMGGGVMRTYMGHANKFFNDGTGSIKGSKPNFWEMIPNNSLATAGYTLAKTGSEYIVYLPSGGSTTVNLSAVTGSFNVEWFNPRTGAYTSAAAVSGGASKTFTAADTNDWVLHLNLKPMPVLTRETGVFKLDGVEISRFGIRATNALESDVVTQRLIDNLDSMKTHGIQSVSISLQGAKTGTTETFNSDGTLRSVYANRLANILDALVARQMVGVVNFFYQARDEDLTDSNAVRAATTNATNFLKPWRNVWLNVINEWYHGGFTQPLMTSVSGRIELFNLIKSLDPQRITHVSDDTGAHDGFLSDTGTTTSNGNVVIEYARKDYYTADGGVPGDFDNTVDGTTRTAIQDAAQTTFNNKGYWFWHAAWHQQADSVAWPRYDKGGAGTAADPGVSFIWDKMQALAATPLGPCTISSAFWSATTTTQGQSVGLTANTSGSCVGKSVKFEVRRNGILFDDIAAQIQPNDTAINGGIATGSWIAEYNPLIPGTDPDYYFKANVAGDPTIVESNPRLLKVTQGTVLTEVPKYGIFEVALTDSGNYTNPYFQMPSDSTTPGFVTGTFTGPGGTPTITIDGFWDGGDTWKIRMAPTVEGTWTYTTSSTDSGLNGKTGSFNVTTSTSKGFVRVNPTNKHHFQWDDGTPFYWAPVTLMIAHFDGGSGGRLTDGTYQNLINTRSSQGFSVTHWGYYGFNKPEWNNQTQANEGGAPFTSYNPDLLNPAYYQKGDERVQLLLNQGVIPQFMLGWPDQNIWGSIGDAKMKRYWRYLIARYAAYNITYNLFGEGNEFGAGWETTVNDYGNLTKKWDPYKHLVTTHLTGGPDATLANQSWYDYVMLQLPTTQTSNYLSYNKPVVNVEYCGYEESLNCGRTTPVMADEIRPMVWDVRMRGGYFDYETRGTDLQSMGAKYSSYANLFFRDKTKFWLLESRPDLFGSIQGLANPGQEYVVYLKTGGSVTVNLSGVSGTFDAKWYNPRTGVYGAATSTVSGGVSRTLTAPDTNDWVLHLTLSGASPTTTPTSGPTPTPTPASGPCSVSSASWSTATATQGQSVGLTASTTGTCTGKSVHWEVRRNGTLFDDIAANTQPADTSISGTTSSTTWVAEYNPLLPGTDPDYYFKANVAGDTTIVESNPRLLRVTSSGPTPTPTPVQAGADWPQLQKDSQHSGYVPQTVGPPYTELWRVTKQFPVSSRVQPIVAQGLVFIPSNDGSIYALNTTSGSTAWSYKTGGALVNTAAFDNGRVFFGSTDNYVYALNASSGSLIWKYKTGSTVKTAPVVAGGRVFIGSSDGNMYALDAATNNSAGLLIWKRDIGAPIYDSAAFDNGKVFFGGLNSVGYALNAADGTIAWQKEIRGQGFRDRWTVAGNGKVFFTPMLYGSSHAALSDGNYLFHSDVATLIYNQPWSTQKQAILNLLAAKPYQQPLYVLDQNSGVAPFVPPVLYASGGSQSPHAQPILLPNGNANVIYRRSFGEPSYWGPTTNDALYTGELDLTTGDIIPVDTCNPLPAGSTTLSNCGPYKSPFTSDESSALVRSGDIIYLDVARGTVGLDTLNKKRLQTAVCYNPTSGGPFCETGSITFNDYVDVASGNGWRIDKYNPYGEMDSDGNNIKRPTPIVDDTFYILHYGTILAVKGTKR
ncbi:PQQ-binding-like beta-propeller repeat protein [Candidatus Microgenomates bacterium]|nr:PQQ-binding-like beta-propeller repeat protein [Candidatus Microgenomates bacterium]